jgi:hypothetical protein
MFKVIEVEHPPETSHRNIFDWLQFKIPRIIIDLFIGE